MLSRIVRQLSERQCPPRQQLDTVFSEPPNAWQVDLGAFIGVAGLTLSLDHRAAGYRIDVKLRSPATRFYRDRQALDRAVASNDPRSVTEHPAARQPNVLCRLHRPVDCEDTRHVIRRDPTPVVSDLPVLAPL